MRNIGRIVAALVIALSAVAPTAEAQLFEGTSAMGAVWAGTQLAAHRTTEDYTPVLVIVQNRADTPIELDRQSFSLYGADGTKYPLASVSELRENYKMQTFDLTMARFYGLPIGTKLDETNLIPSNFFPLLSIGMATDGVLNDHIELPTLYWMIDLLYFEQPPGFAEGRDVVLEVDAKGWEAPMRVPININVD